MEQQLRERSETMWEKQGCRHKSQWRGRGRGCSRHQSRDSPAAHGVDRGEAGCLPAAHGGPWWSRYPPAARGRPHAGAGGCPNKGVTLWTAHTWTSSWYDLWPHGERSSCWSRFAGRACDPMGDPCWSRLFLKDCTPWMGPTMGQFEKNFSLWKGFMLEKFVENCPLWEAAHVWRRRRVWEVTPWEGRRVTDNVWWAHCGSHSPCPCAAWGEKVENWEWS